jgi:hypothetical protein
MNKILLLLFSVVTLSSCVKYEEPTLVSLPGEYIIDKITVTDIEGNSSMSDSTYLPGDVFINQNDTFPLDSVVLGSTRWHFDYSVVSFAPETLPWGEVEWGEKYFYRLVPSWSVYDLGYVDMNLGSRRLVLKIIDDSAESLTFRTTGQWTFLNTWEEKSITIHMTRVGP